MKKETGIDSYPIEYSEVRNYSEEHRKTRILIEVIGGLFFIFFAINQFFSHSLLINALKFIAGTDTTPIFLNYFLMLLVGISTILKDMKSKIFFSESIRYNIQVSERWI